MACETIRAQVLVDSIAGLKNLDVSEHESATVRGYYGSGDGGSGEFVWIAGSVTATNFGTVFKGRKRESELPTGRWIRTASTEMVHNVKWFGARGDSVTDDTASVASAFKSLPSGGILEVPNGTYVVTTLSLVHTNVTIRGSGTLRAKKHVAEFVRLAGSDLRVEGIELDGNNRAAAVLTIGVNSSACVINNTRFANAYVDDALDPDGTSSAKLLQVKRGARRITISNSQFTNVTYAAAPDRVAGGIWVNDYGWTSPADNVESITISGCTFDGISPGADGGCIRISTSPNYDAGITITSNRFLNFGRRAIKIFGNAVTATDNYAETHDTHAYSAFSAYGERCVFERNTIVGEYFKGIEYGVAGRLTGGRASSNNIAFGPMRASVAVGVEIRQDADGIVVDANGVSNSAYHTVIVGRARNVVVSNSKGTNILTAGVQILREGADSPSDCSIFNTLISGAPKYGVRVDAGTNITVDGVTATAQWGAVYFAPGVKRKASP